MQNSLQKQLYQNEVYCWWCSLGDRRRVPDHPGPHPGGREEPADEGLGPRVITREQSCLLAASSAKSGQTVSRGGQGEA